MRTCMTYALSLAITVCSSVVFAGAFEGVIHMKSTFFGEEPNISESDWFIKGDHIRMERKPNVSEQSDTGRMGALIFNADRKVRYVLIPKRKMYVEQSSEDTFEKTSEYLKDLKYEIVRTGKTDTVAGNKCEVFQNKNKETGQIRGESCAVKGLANMGALMGVNRSDAWKLSSDVPPELRQIIKQGYFLVRMVTQDDNGAEEMRMEATSIEKKRLDNSLFVPPVDYTKFDVNAIMQQRRKASQEGGPGDQAQGKLDVQQLIRDMQKRKAEQSGASGSLDSGGQQREMQDLMKNIEGMMKKKQQGGQ
jgi:hypothetical protein